MPSATTADAFRSLVDHARETALLKSTMGLLQWDEETYLPPAGGPYRAEQLAYLAGLVHRRETDPQVGDWLAAAADTPEAADPHSATGAVVHGMQRDYAKRTKLPQALVEELTRTSSLGQQAWKEARREDNFATFLPMLEKTIDLKRQEAAAYGYDASPYDALLDDYEPGETAANVARVLGGLREQLTPLVEKIAASGRRPGLKLAGRHYPRAAQEAFGKRAAAAIGFDFDAGRLDVTAHPFCGGAGPRDIRLTTRYDEDDFAGGLFSILHEAGHGMYEQGLEAESFGLPTGEAVSLGIHESQSRMWENLVGRSRAFWRHFLPPLVEAFPEALAGADAEAFYFAINESRPSLIRTESDEATYNLHIAIRFELEQALLAGDLPVADLPAAWDEKYDRYLGIRPPSAADGVLQDVHWGAGLVGYFPTYALGNLYASQFFAQATHELSDLDEQFARGEFQTLHAWLRKNIHQHGRAYSAPQLVQRVTGEPLSHGPLIAHLTAKYGELYGFS
ncbi:MAG: carboxypeptidase M32 [Planctomycetota bacterium]